jgi:Ca-activated chloride channel family protein
LCPRVVEFCRLSDLDGTTADETPGDRTTADETPNWETCPDCGGPVDLERAIDVDSDVAAQLGSLSGPVHGIGTSDLTVTASGTGGDDWRPRHDGRSETRGPSHADEHVVCLDCGRDVTDYYRERVAEARRERRADDESGGMQDLVQEALESPEAERLSDLGYADASTAVGPSTQKQADVSRSPQSVGMATGGAKDATNFRDNVREGYVPQPDALTYEGLFYDYYFDTGRADDPPSDSLFYPSYATAVTDSPVTGEREQYLTVGLNSTLTEADLERKPLNLVAVVDVSGSMNSQFDQYYYDEHGSRRAVEADGDGTKMAAAREALTALTEQLRPEDKLGVVLYNSTAHVAKPLREVEETNMDAIRSHIREITADGGTDMSAGFEAAVELLEPHHGADLSAVENRIVFLTDAMPNLGTTDRGSIVDQIDDAADDHVHTTFVGIGLDTNADLVESLSSVRGANHYFVHSTAEFTRRLADEFTYVVTPLVFDLSLDLVSDGYSIESVYGSPNADRATGEVMHVETLFPSPTSEGETRGGVTLLRLRETDPDASVELVANWVERDGTRGRDAVELSIPDPADDSFDNTGIRKAVALSRYGRHLRAWMEDVRAGSVDDWNAPERPERTEWEAESVPLTVPESYRDTFETLRAYLRREGEALGDDTLTQEVAVLDVLIDPSNAGETPPSERSHPDRCPNCDTDISAYGPDPHFCPECGVAIE